MNVNDLKRHRWMHFSDLPHSDRVSVLVVHGIETVYEPIRDDRGFQIGEEPVHLVHFVGYPKPLKLNNPRLESIALVLGEDTDDWVGRKLGLIPGPVTYWGETKTDIVVWHQPVDQYEPTPPVSRRFAQAVASSKSLPGAGAGGAPGGRSGFGSRPTGYGAVRAPAHAQLPAGGPPIGASPEWDARPIGERNAANMQTALAEQGVAFSDFLVWLKAWDPTVYERAVGVPLSDLARGVVPFIQTYLRNVPQQPGPAHPPAPGLVPVGHGGPVPGPAIPGGVGGPPGRAGATVATHVAAAPSEPISFMPPAPGAAFEPVSEEDIPF